MSSITEKRTGEYLELVEIQDRELVETYIVCPPHSSEKELETMWILAEREDFIPLESAR